MICHLWSKLEILTFSIIIESVFSLKAGLSVLLFCLWMVDLARFSS